MIDVRLGESRRPHRSAKIDQHQNASVDATVNNSTIANSFKPKGTMQSNRTLTKLGSWTDVGHDRVGNSSGIDDRGEGPDADRLPVPFAESAG